VNHAPRPPADAPERQALHAELHARPAARIRLPALVVYVAVRHAGLDEDAELAHLRRLPGHDTLDRQDLAHQFLRLKLRLPELSGALKWERHSEFTRYSLTLPLPELSEQEPAIPAALADWIAAIPGQTLVALQLAMLARPDTDEAAQALARQWLGDAALVASRLGRSAHSLVFSDLRLRDSGFERMLLLTDGSPTETPTQLRNGRLAQRVLEFQTYRVMALLGLPLAKSLSPELGACERELAQLTDALQREPQAEQQQLDTLIALAARVEHLTARHGYRFAATRAYHGIVQQRLVELAESALPGIQTLGGFTLRRLTPAMATVQSTADRLASLSQRIERCSALLRTRVDIAAEAQQQRLLSQLTRGQALQLSLQTTVEGLSIAAISYYVVSLLGYGLKALKSAGVPLNLEIATGAMIPLVLWGVWRGTQRIHARLNLPH
jgi:uncharacterized membrane-anchored protein